MNIKIQDEMDDPNMDRITGETDNNKPMATDYDHEDEYEAWIIKRK